MIVLIPAFQPDDALPHLVVHLLAAEPRLLVLVVDDGSGPAYSALFDDARHAGATVIGYPSNKGKGQALKTGFGYAERHHPGQGVICADSDGQHAVPDILRVAAHLRGTASTSRGTGLTMVLGERRFDGEVPVRSRLGNALTRSLFRLSSGVELQDTQTGLRGYPAEMLPWLRSVRGDRYEYELNLLLQAGPAGHRIDSIPIATIYLEGNSSSHFRPLVDSARIYAPLLRFSLSSLTAFGIDLVAFVVLGLLADSLLVAVVGARVISSSVNFLVNRRLVFPHSRCKALSAAALRYFALVVALLAANYAAIFLLTDLGMPDIAAKVLTEVLLFVASFTVQRRFLGGEAPAGVQHTGTATPGGRAPGRAGTAPAVLAAPCAPPVRVRRAASSGFTPTS
jgi:putative flippase GtrA